MEWRRRWKKGAGFGRWRGEGRVEERAVGCMQIGEEKGKEGESTNTSWRGRVWKECE